MRNDYTYEVHKSVGAHRVRHWERDLGHRRALKAYGQSSGLVSRMADGLERMRSLAKQQSRIVYDRQMLSDKVCRLTEDACRLTDGSTGRLAVCISDGERVELCVPAPGRR